MQYSFTIRKRGNDNYQLILSYKGRDGKWHQKAKGGFKKSRFAKSDDEKSKLLDAVRDLLAVDTSNADITLADFLEIYADDRKIRPRTKTTYENACHTLGEAAKLPMRSITAALVKKALLSAGLKSSTKNVKITILKTLFKSAYEDYSFLPNNPLQKLKMYRNETKILPYKILTDKEVEILLSDTSCRPAYPVIAAIGALAGLRINETLGLILPNVHLKSGCISVDKQWGVLGNGKYGFCPLKTVNSYRMVPIPPRLRDIISAYIGSRKVVDMDGRLFPGEYNVRFNEWMNEKVGKSSHALRHTYITRLVANGINIKTVAALAGDTPVTILEHYVHFTDEMREQAKNDIIRIFG